MARPSDYTPELAATICQSLVDGMSLRSVCRDEAMPSISSVMLWLTRHPEFSEQYAKATDERAVGMFEDMFEIADFVDKDPAAVSKAKLQVDVRKWALSRMNPKKYGDKLTTELTGADGGPVKTEAVVDWSGVPSDAIQAVLDAVKAGDK